MIKCCEIDFFLWHMWHAGQVPSYKRIPLTRKRDTFHSNTAPLAPFAERKSVSVFAIFLILLEEVFFEDQLVLKTFRTKNSSVLSKKKSVKLKSWYVSGALGPSIPACRSSYLFASTNSKNYPLTVCEKNANVDSTATFCGFFCFIFGI